MRIYNGGTYDLLHPGHLSVFRQMRDLVGPDGEVVIGLNTDEFVQQFKGHAPVQSYAERVEILRAIRGIDRVVKNIGGADSKPVLEVVEPDIIAAGYDWSSPDDSRYCRQMGFTKDWLREHGIRLIYLERYADLSSTRLRAIASQR